MCLIWLKKYELETWKLVPTAENVTVVDHCLFVIVNQHIFLVNKSMHWVFMCLDFINIFRNLFQYAPLIRRILILSLLVITDCAKRQKQFLWKLFSASLCPLKPE